MKKNKKFNNAYLTMGIAILAVLLIFVTYLFANYTKSDYMNNVVYSKLSYRHDPSDLITLVNVFPINSSELVEDLNNHGTVTVIINGQTDDVNGVEYIVKLDQVDNTINDKSVPITYHAAVSNLGEVIEDYLNNRNIDKNIYQLNETGSVYSNAIVAIGYVKKGEVFNGSITLTAYVDADRIGIYSGNDTQINNYSETGAVIPEYYFKRDDESNIVVFTPDEWEEINERGISFKVRVEMNNGLWITK